MTQAAPTQQQAQARKPDFHTKPSEADVRFTLSQSLMNDTLDILVQIAHGMQSFAEADIVLMPLYYYSHFIVVVFFVAAGFIVHFDSINKGRFKVSTAQEAVLVEFAQRFIINKKWEVEQGSFEQQRDSFTCGYRAFTLCRTFYNARDM
ncbi:hypothetical protein V8C86DRAFT_3124448 [Haematococcus lacustris]